MRGAVPAAGGGCAVVARKGAAPEVLPAGAVRAAAEPAGVVRVDPGDVPGVPVQ